MIKLIETCFPSNGLAAKMRQRTRHSPDSFKTSFPSKTVSVPDMNLTLMVAMMIM